jgi:hypothetical protein
MTYAPNYTRAHWTPEEDEFLLSWHEMGICFIADHDLNRSPRGAENRFRKLTKNGARQAFLERQIADQEYRKKRGWHTYQHTEDNLRAQLAEVLAITAPEAKP